MPLRGVISLVQSQDIGAGEAAEIHQREHVRPVVLDLQRIATEQQRENERDGDDAFQTEAQKIRALLG